MFQTTNQLLNGKGSAHPFWPPVRLVNGKQRGDCENSISLKMMKHANPQGNHKFNNEDISYLSARKNNVPRHSSCCTSKAQTKVPPSQLGVERNQGGLYQSSVSTVIFSWVALVSNSRIVIHWNTKWWYYIPTNYGVLNVITITLIISKNGGFLSHRATPFHHTW